MTAHISHLRVLIGTVWPPVCQRMGTCGRPEWLCNRPRNLQLRTVVVPNGFLAVLDPQQIRHCCLRLFRAVAAAAAMILQVAGAVC